MEKAKDVLGLGLSPGFKFTPDDDELVENFLLRRVQGQQLPLEGMIFEDDPLSAPPWDLLKKYERDHEAFFFANGQAMHENGGRKQRRSCVGGGYWEGQQVLVKGDRLRVPGMEITWRKYMLNFHADAMSGSVGWVMHEYSITDPVHLASSSMRVYRIRFSGYGKDRKREPDDCGGNDGGAEARAEHDLVEEHISAANGDGSARPVATSYSDQDYRHQLVNAMHNWPQQVDSFQDFAVPNSALLPAAEFGDYAVPGMACAEQYIEEHGSAVNSVFPMVVDLVDDEDGGTARPAATSHSQQDYQYRCVNGTDDWNQVGSCQNLVVPSQDAYVGDYASSNQYFMGGNLGAHSATPPASGVMNEYDDAAPAAGMAPFGQGSSSGAIDESFLDQDINIDDYLVDDLYLAEPLHDQY